MLSRVRRGDGGALARIVCAVVLLLALVIAPRGAGADPLPIASVPEPLRTYVPWVLDENPEAACTVLESKDAPVRCAWPARLSLSVDEKGGKWKQSFHLDARQWVPLPGDAKRWPQDVMLDRKRAVVVAREGLPHVAIGPGDHVVEGVFLWDAPPESLMIPPETGLLALTVRGEVVPAPNREATGVVWLSRAGAKEEGDRLELTVHRRVTDGVPLLLATRVELNVAGKNREVLLGKALPAGFVPLSLESPIPARVEPDGRLRVQARPGTFVLTLIARSEGPVTEIGRPAPDGPWREGEEIWVFEAKGELRLVTLEGVASIDPQQTSLPAEWKRLPAYPMRETDRLRFVERRRGDADPPPDQLTLERALWLDFDGHGYTVHDRIKGSLGRDGRIEMAPPTALGRVAVRQTDRFITFLGDAKTTGVELRRGPLELAADSRVEGDVGDVPAVGWAHDFQRVSGVLHLPPGFRLLHASGVDEVPTTWIRHWSLLELFLALVSAIAVGRLYGIRWGALALVLFALTFPEEAAPKWVFVPVLATEALVRALAHTKASLALRMIRFTTVVILLLVSIPFLVGHVRQGIYPVLARPYATLGSGSIGGGGDGDGRRAAAEDFAPEEAPRGKADAPTLVAPAAPAPTGTPIDLPSSGYGRGAAGKWKRSGDEVDPNAMVQTGPGLPRWQWTQVDLRWSGPVERTQRLRLYLLSPEVNRALAIVRALLVIALVLRLLPWIASRGPAWWRIAPKAAAAMLALLVFVPGTARAEVPDRTLLDDLAKRITRRADCVPACASSPRLLLEASGDVLRLRIALDAAARTAVPLPGGAVPWSEVLVDGREAPALLLHDGLTWIALEPGSHVVTLSASLRGRESAQLALRLKPHRVETTLDGWTLDGVHEDGLADDDLQLSRVLRKPEAQGPGLAPGVLPPFVRVERTMLLGQTWTVETKVTRASPSGSAIVLEIPLLPRESVTTAELRVVAGKVLVNMGPQVTEVAWRSVLEQQSPLVLTASKGTPTIEVWRLDVSPIWHTTFTGIPFVHASADAERSLPELRPWPGEQVSVAIVRPDGVPGRTLTIDQSTLVVRPGVRATDVDLSLSIRSSRGGEHTLGLPAGAQLSKVALNGKTQPIRQEGTKVTLPIVPGAQTVELSFRTGDGWSALFRTPGVDLGAPSVNTTVTVEGTGARWLLAMGGLPTGPVVLFWSLILVLLVVAWGLGRSSWTPLGTASWALLGVGLSQVSVASGALVVGWLFFLGWRRQPSATVRHHWFNLRQVGIVTWTLVALITLAVAVHQGLLRTPEMQVEGNGSHYGALRWFTDRSTALPASAWIVSVPVLVYRGLMLAWALWVALAVLRWLRWGWEGFGMGGYWWSPASDPYRVQSAPSGQPAAQSPQPVAPAADEPRDPGA